MNEFLDVYDKDKNYIGKFTRKEVHEKGLWHNTVHCWLYDKEGNIFFQRRKDKGTLYTTASGHVVAGETITEAFSREISEEIGLNIDKEKCIFANIVIWQMDEIRSDGTRFFDQVFANVYLYEYNGALDKFNYQDEELSCIVRVNAKEVLELLKAENGKIKGFEIVKNNNIIEIIEKDIYFSDFLVNKHETALGKYQDILLKVIELTNENN
jgi:isopentenyldiphosphate isomerase